LAISFAEDGIRVNAIAPGWIKTEMTRALRENLELSEFRSKVVARIPGGQWAEPEDLAGVAIFLASSASKLIKRRNDSRGRRILREPARKLITLCGGIGNLSFAGCAAFGLGSRN